MEDLPWQSDSNVGLITGKVSGIAVVDADDQDAVKWCLENLPHTPVRVKTGKGYHFYFKWQEGVDNTARTVRGVDIRGQGGYVVAPPSIHPSGARYTWDIDKGASPADIPAFPASLMVTAKGNLIPTAPTNIPIGLGEGSRNHTIAQWAGVFLGKGYPPQEVLEPLLAINDTFKPPLSRREVEQTLMSIAGRHQRQHGKTHIEISPTAHLMTWEEKVKSWKDKPMISFGIPDLDKTYGGGIFPSEILSIVGAPGAMKTSLAIQAITNYLNSSNGRVLFLNKDMSAGKTLTRFLLPDLQTDETNAIKMMQADDPMYLEAKKKMLSQWGDRLAITDNDPINLKDLEKLIDRYNPNLLVLDYITKIDGYKDELECTRAVMKRLLQIATTRQVAMILLSQMSRASRANQKAGSFGGNALGGGDVERTSDVEIELIKEQEPGSPPYIVATVTKVRRGQTGRSFKLKHDFTLTFSPSVEEMFLATNKRPLFQSAALCGNPEEQKQEEELAYAEQELL